MGPRQLSRGISRATLYRWMAEYSFNGATAIEPWNLSANVYLDEFAFHASMGPRQLSRGIPAPVRKRDRARVLQWGHGN